MDHRLRRDARQIGAWVMLNLLVAAADVSRHRVADDRRARDDDSLGAGQSRLRALGSGQHRRARDDDRASAQRLALRCVDGGAAARAAPSSPRALPSTSPRSSGSPYVHTLAWFAVLLVLATLGSNVALSAYQVMLPESVPRRYWGVVSGVRGVATLAGSVLGFAIAGPGAKPSV